MKICYRNTNIFLIFYFEENVNDIPNICHNVPGTSTKQYMHNMPPVALIFPSTWKSPRIPPAYAKKIRIPILRTLEIRMPKFAYVRWFAYAWRQEYQISVRTQKTCVRKDKNTAPGPDGFTVPFYMIFWTELGDLIHSALKESYDRGFLPEEMRRSITVLIPKKSKDPRFVENLRPISLLNVVFKILTIALARRISNVIDRLVSGDQTGFIKGRYIGENIRLVLDLIQHTAEKKKEGLLLFCDWEKAYDSLDWEYLRAVLRRLKFEENFIKWVSLIYPNLTSAAPKAQLQINGQLSEPYEILRGLRQGCPLSCSLFLLGIEQGCGATGFFVAPAPAPAPG